MKIKKYVLSLFTILVVVAVFGIYYIAKVHLLPGVGFGRKTYTSMDSTLIMNRHMGYINYERFVKFSQEKLPNGCLANISIKGDSVYFTTLHSHYFFGQNNEWTKQYKNLPIQITSDGFNAKLSEIDSIQYILLPYQILANIAKIGESSVPWDEGLDEEQRATIRDINDLPTANPLQGNKIQTEGNVRKNVADILSQYPHCEQKEQLKILWRFAKEHWNYLNDPYSTTDTWRPASETIDDYYFVNGRCYTGDCDDFAILMASFARQLGFDSHIIVAFGNDGGHAYAEFNDNRKWIPLDWFSDEFGGKPYEVTIIKTIDNI